MKRHKNIKRILHRIKEEIKATIRISKITSVKKALITLIAKFDIQILNKNGYKETKRIKNNLISKHEIMIEYYEKNLGAYLKNYDFNDIKHINSEDHSSYIWICWWQGIDNAPEIVKKCVSSIRDAAGEHKVVIITFNNYKDYIDVPKTVEEKFKKGIITLTNFSDLLRLSLLSKYGGMWLDATFFCKQGTQLNKYFKYPLWTIKRPDYGHVSVACGTFAGYSWYCGPTNRWMFKAIKDLFVHYWETNDFMVDYLMIDYMTAIAQKYNKEIAEEFRKIPENNPYCDELCKRLNKKYSENEWNSICKDTDLFKLTWKQKFNKKIRDEETFYSKVIINE